MLMETLFKIGITIVVIALIYFQIIFLRGVWKSQIDIRATCSKLMRKLSPEEEIIVTRDPAKIYQNGKVVGEVTGSVEVKNDFTIFKELTETEGLVQNMPFEYQRYRLKIINVGTRTGMKVVTSNKGSQVKKSVISDVVCKEVKQ